MKREIKFRGKAKLDGKWWFGNLVPKDTCGRTQINDPEHGGCFDIDPETVSQYVGVKDKNGREIYEGDILRGDYYPYHDDGEDNYLGVVFFADDDYTWEVMKFVTAKSERSGISNFDNNEFYEVDFSQMEVIGNIWDNKGLFRDSDESIMEWFNG